MPQDEISSIGRDDQALQRLKKWLEENNVEYDRNAIEITTVYTSQISDTGIPTPVYGVLSKADIPAGAKLCTIPFAAVLSAKTCGIADIIEQEQYEGMFALTVSLFYEMSLSEDSPWYGYIQGLSLDIIEHDSPVLWDKDRLECIKGTDIYNISVRSALLLNDDYKNILLPLFKAQPLVFDSRPGQLEMLNLRNFMLCASHVKNKAFKFSNGCSLGLVPLVDTFNVTSSTVDVNLVSGSDTCVDCGRAEAYCKCDLTDDWEAECDPYMEDDMMGDEEDCSTGSDVKISFPPAPILDVNSSEFDTDRSIFVTKQHNSWLDLIAVRNIPAGKEILCYHSFSKEDALELGWKYFNSDEMDEVVLYNEVDEIITSLCKGNTGEIHKFLQRFPKGIVSELKKKMRPGLLSRKVMWKSRFFYAVRENIEICRQHLSKINEEDVCPSTYISELYEFSNKENDMYSYTSLQGESVSENDIYNSQKISIKGYPSPELLIYLHILLLPKKEYKDFCAFPKYLSKYVFAQILKIWLSKLNKADSYIHNSTLVNTLSYYIIHTSIRLRLEKYPKTIQEDSEYLNTLDQVKDRHLIWALRARIREMEILSHVMNNTILPSLSGLDAEA